MAMEGRYTSADLHVMGWGDGRLSEKGWGWNGSACLEGVEGGEARGGAGRDRHEEEAGTGSMKLCEREWRRERDWGGAGEGGRGHTRGDRLNRFSVFSIRWVSIYFL